MKILNYRDMDPSPMTKDGAEGVTIRWLVTKEDGASNFAMRLFEISPGGRKPLHTNDQEHEVFILEGSEAV